MNPHPLFAAIDEPWFVIDAQLRIVEVLTRAAAELSGGRDVTGTPLRALLAPLLSGDDLEALLAALHPAPTPRALAPVTMAAPGPAGATITRVLEPVLRSAADGAWLLGLRDVTELHNERAALAHARSEASLALALLAAPPDRLRQGLGAATASVTLIRSLLNLPARDADALGHKVERIRGEVRALRDEAATLGLTGIVDAARACEHIATALGHGQQAGGDEFLPLAARLNDLFAQVNAAVALAERRSHAADPAAALRLFVDALARSRGVQVRLVPLGLEQLPSHLRQPITDLLRQLLADTLEHRIELPDQRLEAGKPVQATLTVQLSRQASLFKLLVQDDGRGFEQDGHGREAVARGLVPVMDVIRETIARLGGRIQIATHAGRYTRFRMLLPSRPRTSQAPQERVSADRHEAYRALP